MNNFEQLKQTIEEAKQAVFSEMESILESCQEDVNKFYEKGNKSAGSRIRKSAQLVRKQIHHPTIRQHFSKIEDAAKALRESIS